MLTIDAPADQLTIRLLLPGGVQKANASINGRPVSASIEKIRASRYVVVKARGSKNQVQIRYQ
jgi:hypothetical protein